MATASEEIAAARVYADQLTQLLQAQQAAVSAAAATSPTFPTGYVVIPPVIDRVVDAISTIKGALPAALSTVNFTGTSPVVPSLSITELTRITATNFTDTPEAISLPTKPTALLEIIPNAPTLTNPTAPESPTYTLPEVPTLPNIQLPDKPTLTIPATLSSRLDIDVSNSNRNFEFAEKTFYSALSNNLQSKLLADLDSGGYGIEVADEAQLWDRAADRERAAGRLRSEEIERNIASRGFEMPPGALIQAQQDSMQALQNASITLSRDIAIKRADLFVQNRQFTIQQTQQVVAILLNFHGAMMERFLNAAKFTHDASIAFFNVKVEAAKAIIAKYQAEADVWVKTIEGEKAKVELYRAELEGEKIKGELDARRVAIYNAQLQGVQTIADIYKTRVGAMQASADIERYKLDIFKAQIDGFSGKIKAKELELQVYEAGIRGESIKIELFKNKVAAHVAKISADRLQLDGNIEEFRAGISKAEFEVRKYEVELKKYQVDSDKYSRDQGVNADVYRSNVASFSARSQSAIALADLQIKNNATQVQSQIGLLNFNISAARLQLDNITNSRQQKTYGAVSVMNSSAQTAASALSGINAVVQQSKAE